RGRATQENCAWKAKTMSSPTATSCISDLGHSSRLTNLPAIYSERSFIPMPLVVPRNSPRSGIFCACSAISRHVSSSTYLGGPPCCTNQLQRERGDVLKCAHL